MLSNNSLHDLSGTTANYTNAGFSRIRDGFDNNPNVGTETHEFTFQQDPWLIISTNGISLVKLSSIIISISKVFNPNNTTDSFFVLSWTPENFYSPVEKLSPLITITFKDSNSGTVLSEDLSGLGKLCGVSPVQSKKRTVDPLIFDRISSGVFTLGSSAWSPC